jgi:adenylyltransferase/sulfurtransferase
VLNAAAVLIASLQAAEAIKILSGHTPDLSERLVSCDLWTARFQSIRVARDPACRACGQHNFTWLEGKTQPHVTLCGRDSVQIHERRRRLELESMARQLAGVAADVRTNGFLLRFRVDSYEVTVFPDGRAVFKGTQDPAVARSLYARYIGA